MKAELVVFISGCISRPPIVITMGSRDINLKARAFKLMYSNVRYSKLMYSMVIPMYDTTTGG